MLHKKLLLIIGLLSLVFAAACSPALEPETGEPDATPTQAVVLQPADDDVEDPQPGEESGEEVQEPQDDTPPDAGEGAAEDEPGQEDEGDLANLPQLPAPNPNQGGIGGGFGGGGGGPAVAETSVVVDEGPIPTDDGLFEPFNPFENTNWVLNAGLPADISAATVWQQPAIYPDPQAAFALAQKLNFPLPLYQEKLPADMMPEIEMLDNGVFRMPFFALRNNEWLTIFSGSAYYENRTAAFRSTGQSTIPFDQTRPLAEQQIAAWGGLNFDYELVDQGFGSVMVQRLVNGQPLDYPEMYFQFDDSGTLLFASYNVLSDLNPVGDYPLISPQAAWEKIQGGVIENEIWFNYIFDPATAAELTIAPVDPDQEFQYWQRTYEPGDTVRIVGYPIIYLPVQSDGLPLVMLDQYRVIGPAELLFDLTENRPNQILLEGTVSADGRTIEMTDWEPADDLEPLFLEGTVFQEDMGVVLRTVDGQEYMLLDVPAGVENEMNVYVFGWRAEESDLFAFPVLDWINIEKRIEFPDEVGIEQPIEPDYYEEYDPQIAEVVIDTIELTYQYIAQWPEFAPDEPYVQPEYDMPPVFVQPFWRFSGTNDKGEKMSFSVPAVDPAYFQQ